jgi:hypothetical protein
MMMDTERLVQALREVVEKDMRPLREGLARVAERLGREVLDERTSQTSQAEEGQP